MRSFFDIDGSPFLMTSGVLWTITYIIIIIRAFQDKRHGMPYMSVFLNISWEFMFSFVLPHDFPQRAVNYVWVSLDCVLLFQLVRYFPKDDYIRLRERGTEKGKLNLILFIIGCVCVLVTTFTLHYTITITLNDYDGAYSAFGINVIMSILFCYLVISRKNLEGQNIYIGILKCLGTLFASLAFYNFDEGKNDFRSNLYLAALFWDLMYIILLIYYSDRRRILQFNPTHKNNFNPILGNESDELDSDQSIRLIIEV